MLTKIKKLNPFKKSLPSLLSGFAALNRNLRSLAEVRVKEAAEKEAKARKLMAEVEAAEVEAEEALSVADRIEALIGSSIVLEAAEDHL